MALESQATIPAKTRFGPLAARNFRLVWLGEGVSVFGDQFFLIALPWLVLRLTDSGVALGAIFVVSGVPRLLLMLAGGALSDRFSPRRLMLFSNGARAALTLILTVLVVLDRTQLWMLYVLAFGFGITDAFFQPAVGAIIPQLVHPAQIAAANALHEGTALTIQTVGAGVAGLAVKLLGEGLAFAFDTLTFVFASAMLLLVRDTRPPEIEPSSAASLADHARIILADIRAGFSYAGEHRALRHLLLTFAAINLLWAGPMVIGPPKLAADRFPEGAAALGLITAGFAIGALAGTFLAGVLKPRRVGLVIMLMNLVAAPLMIAVGFAPHVWVAAGLTLILGLLNGIVDLIYLSWVQRNVVPDMLGRVMSLVMLTSAGISPLSFAVAGVLAQIDVRLLYGLAGALLFVVALVSLRSRELYALTG